MRKAAHKISLHIVGWFCIAAGAAGLILPFLPGIVLVGIGLYVLSLGWLWLYIKIEVIKTRFPKLAHAYDVLDKKVSKYISKAH